VCTGSAAAFSTVRRAASGASAATCGREASSRCPQLLSLWPARILIYGQNLFRTGGDDFGRGDRIFGGLLYLAFAWCAVLLVIGVRSVHGWSWGRSLATVSLAAALPALIVFATVA
jgi:hypothetical protein